MVNMLKGLARDIIEEVKVVLHIKRQPPKDERACCGECGVYVECEQDEDDGEDVWIFTFDRHGSNYEVKVKGGCIVSIREYDDAP